ncbi:MAG: hypothetical protein ACXW1Z_12090 [Methylobacter sp.]
MNMTHHAAIRSQQRGIPPLIDLWLDQYGEEEYDGHGGIRRYFSRASIRTMEKEFGRGPLSKLSEYFNSYKVTSSDNGQTITLGHRAKRIKRR